MVPTLRGASGFSIRQSSASTARRPISEEWMSMVAGLGCNGAR